MHPREFDPSEPEMMDRPQGVSESLERSLLNLGTLNRHFGGHRSLRWFFGQRLAPGRKYTILDLATGGGDNPRMLVEECRAKGVGVRIEAVDFQPATLELARRWSEGFPEIRFVEGDLLEFEPEARFDFVYCALALHHFSDDDAVRVLSRAASLARRGVAVVDLERGWPASLSVWLATATLVRDEMTRVDGRLSVRRAFSFEELGELARRAGWKEFGHRRFLPARQAIWMDL